MRQLILLISTILVSAFSFASAPENHKLSPHLKSLSAAWKTQSSMHLKQDKDDLHIVYGGADISRKPTLLLHIATA